MRNYRIHCDIHTWGDQVVDRTVRDEIAASEEKHWPVAREYEIQFC